MPGGGPEITGVSFEFLMSLLLQPKNKQQHKTRSVIASFRLTIANLFFPCSLVTLFGQIGQLAIDNVNSPRHARLKYLRYVRGGAVHRGLDIHLPPTGRDRRAGSAQNRKGEKGCLSTRQAYRRLGISLILKPLKRRAHQLKRCRSFDQYSSFDEGDRTFAAHGIQADSDAFTGRADD